MNNTYVPVVHCDTFALSPEPVGSSNDENNPPSNNKNDSGLPRLFPSDAPPKNNDDDPVKKEFIIPIPDGPHSMPYVAVVENFAEIPEEDSKSQANPRKHACRYCDWCPCVLDQGLYELITSPDYLDDVDYVRANGKAIRYDMYCKSTHFIHGPLPKGRRIQLPTCVVGAIHDMAMEDDVRNYVGFQESSNND